MSQVDHEHFQATASQAAPSAHSKGHHGGGGPPAWFQHLACLVGVTMSQNHHAEQAGLVTLPENKAAVTWGIEVLAVVVGQSPEVLREQFESGIAYLEGVDPADVHTADDLRQLAYQTAMVLKNPQEQGEGKGPNDEGAPSE